MRAVGSLRVLAVGPPLEASGGIGRVMTSVRDALADQPVELRVLDSRGRHPRASRSLGPLLRVGVALVRARRAGRVDVVHVNMSSHGSALRKGLVVRLSKALGLPVVLHLHASSFPEFFERLPGPVRSWVRRTFALATRVVVLGPTWQTYAVDTLAVPPERLVVLPNATPPSPRAAPRREGESLHVVFLGRLGDRKGVPELVAALAGPRLSAMDWVATLAGDGEVERYRAQTQASGLGRRITLTGWIGADEVTRLLGRAHVLVLPSHAEGLPMSVLEAWAAGVPVVCTSAGALADVAVDGVNALVVSAGDVDGLAHALARLAQDEPLRRRLAEGALATWQEGFALEPYVSRLIGVWTSAARRGVAGDPGPRTVVAAP